MARRSGIRAVEMNIDGGACQLRRSAVGRVYLHYRRSCRRIIRYFDYKVIAWAYMKRGILQPVRRHEAEQGPALAIGNALI
jgi:hypothetical protein